MNESFLSPADAEEDRMLDERSDRRWHQRLEQYSEAMPLWLALAPTWPRPLVERGFPTARGIKTGSEATKAVDEFVSAGLARSGRNEADPSLPIYWMTQTQADSFLSFMGRLPQGRFSMLNEMTRAAEAMKSASSGSSGMPLPDDLQRWCTLAVAGPSEQNMAKVLDREIDAAIHEAESRGATECPAARRWIETATPIASRLRGALWISLVRAKRRFELFHRRAADRRMLANFLEKPSQMRPFDALFAEGSDAHWALHYVGSGGAGKTMLIRHLTEKFVPDGPRAVARIDFDHLNPEFPTRAPALLLVAFAEELRGYEKDPAGFDYFNERVATINQEVDARGGSADEQTVMRDVEPALVAFVDALLKLEKQTVLILDTCEELAKLQPDGKIPRNVRITFEILERIHADVERKRSRDMPGLRVIFSGRRALAQRGAGWSARDSKLPPRDYLRLHVMSGFDREEATKYLEDFRQEEKRIDRKQFEKILDESRTSDKTFASKFIIEEGGEEGDAERFNPFDLSMYASMAASGIPIEAGAHTYVKERIIRRLPELLAPLLPALVRLGTFDRDLVQRLLGGRPVDPEALSAEASEQHWIGRVASPDDDPRWRVDLIHRKRLFAYYLDEERDSLEAADRNLAAILPSVTLERPWNRLDLAFFDAALQVMQRDAARTLEWWDAVEQRIAADAEWDWAQQMAATLLALGEDAEGNEVTRIPNALIRAAVRTTHAAAAARMGASEQTDTWHQVLGELSGIDDARAASLRLRARARIVNELQWSPKPLSEVAWTLRDDLLIDRFSIRDDDDLAAYVAYLEGAVEILERIAADPWLDLPVSLKVYTSALRVSPISDPSPFDPQLLRFVDSLQARVAIVAGDIDAARQLFNERSLQWSGEKPRVSGKLYWTPPEDPDARLRLEALRGLALRFDVRSLPGVPLPELPPATIDSDRVTAAMRLRENSSLLPERAIERRAMLLPARTRPCNAHREVPSEYSVEVEERADRGDVEEAIGICHVGMREAEKNGDVVHQDDLARLHARLICRYRLFENGEALSRIVAESRRFEDRELAIRYLALMGDEETIPLTSRRETYEASRRMRLAPNEPPPTARIDPDSSFVDVWLVSHVFLRSAVDSRGPLLMDAISWATQPERQPREAIRILVRISMIDAYKDQCLSRLLMLGERVGHRRAAELIVEESELAGVTSTLHRTESLELAAAWFGESRDRLGMMRATIISALATTPAVTMSQLLDPRPLYVLGLSPEQFSAAMTSENGVEQLTRRIDSANAGMQPWLARLAAACFGRASDRSDKAIAKFEEWLRHKRFFTNEVRLLLRVTAPPVAPSSPGKELFGMMGDLAMVGLGSLLISGVAAVLSSFLISPALGAWASHNSWVAFLIGLVFIALALRVEKRTVIFGGLGIVGILLGLYLLLVNYTFWPAVFGAPRSFGSILAFTALLAFSGSLLGQGKRFAIFLEHLKTLTARHLAINTVESAMELGSFFGRLKGRFELRDVKLYAESSYSLLHETLTSETKVRLERWTQRRRPRATSKTIAKPPAPIPAELVLTDPAGAEICWEAMLHPSLFKSGRAMEHLLGFYRTLLPTRPVLRNETGRTVVIATAGHEGWLPLDGVKGFRTEKIGSVADIAHLFGMPSITRSGIRLQLQDGRGTTRGSLIAPQMVREELAASCCIVQGPPNTSPLRTETDRVVAAQLRRFGAEVFQCGIPLVLVIPPLHPDYGPNVVYRLANALKRRQLTSESAWLALVEELRWIIMSGGALTEGQQRETTAEIAYDVCLYMSEAPDLRPAFRWFGWFRD